MKPKYNMIISISVVFGLFVTYFLILIELYKNQLIETIPIDPGLVLLIYYSLAVVIALVLAFLIHFLSYNYFYLIHYPKKNKIRLITLINTITEQIEDVFTQKKFLVDEDLEKITSKLKEGKEEVLFKIVKKSLIVYNFIKEYEVGGK